jgi:hypothetical protein
MLDVPDVAAGATEADDREGGTEAVDTAAHPACCPAHKHSARVQGRGAQMHPGLSMRMAVGSRCRSLGCATPRVQPARGGPLSRRA